MIVNIGSYKVDGVELVVWEECHTAFMMMEKRIEDLEHMVVELSGEVESAAMS